MSSPSQNELQSSLKNYSLDVKYWAHDFGEGHLMLGNREFLEQWKNLLSEVQINQLVATDNEALALQANYHGKETRDVWSLNHTCEIAFGKQLKQANA